MTSFLRIHLTAWLLGWLWLGAAFGRSAEDTRGHQFLGFPQLSRFAQADGERQDERVFTSAVIPTRLEWNELIASWNVEMPPGSYLKVEARAVYPETATPYYIMGLWSGDTNRHPRESVPRQKDSHGRVDTDTLILVRPSSKLQVRLTFGGDAGQLPTFKFLGLCVTDSRMTPATLPPNRNAWGKLIDVPQRSQMLYPGGDQWCSPTTVSMLLAFWAGRLNRPDLDHDVPDAVREVFDPNWEGTGNWSFNMAFAGSLPGMRASVTRLSDVAELEDWIAHGLPVGLSLCYNKLRGVQAGRSGHLVVCVGFTRDGDVIVNDPGTRKNVRKVYPRQNLIDAWAISRNAVYLVHPIRERLPADRFGHWDIATSDQRAAASR